MEQVGDEYQQKDVPQKVVSSDFMDLYVDTNVFVSNQSKLHPNYNNSKKFFDSCKKQNCIINTSVFTLLEIACNISKKRGKSEAVRYILEIEHKARENNIFFFEPQKNIDSMFSLLSGVISSSIKYGVHTGDTLQIHTIDENNLKINALITWNKEDFENYCKSKKIPLYNPKEFLVVLEDIERQNIQKKELLKENLDLRNLIGKK